MQHSFTVRATFFRLPYPLHHTSTHTHLPIPPFPAPEQKEIVPTVLLSDQYRSYGIQLSG